MKTLPTFLALLVSLGTVGAQSPFQTTGPARSVTGQFIAFASTSPSPSRFYRADTNSIPLDPAMLVISCERIKQALSRRLQVTAPAKGRIYLHLRPARFDKEAATLVVEPVLDRWGCRVDLPDATDPASFIRVIGEATLLELANRGAKERSAEIPLWLTEGLCQELLATEKNGLLMPPGLAGKNGEVLQRLLLEGRRENPIHQAQEVLRNRTPLTFEQLSWPVQEQLSPEALPVYRSSLQLFTSQLLKMKSGPDCVRAVLENLPRHYNWQFAFLEGFQPHFATLLDVEKWWALQLVQFTGRDLMQAWTAEESWTKLDQVVRPAAEIRASSTNLPIRTELTLQTVIRDWDGMEQMKTLQQKARELDLLRPRVAQELAPLVDDYREVIGTYLRKQNFSGTFLFFRRNSGPIRNRLAENTVTQLDALEARRQAARVNGSRPLAAAAGTIPTPAP